MTAARVALHVDAQQSCEQVAIDPLRVTERVVSNSFVAYPDVEHAVAAKQECAAIVSGVAIALFDHAEFRMLVEHPSRQVERIASEYVDVTTRVWRARGVPEVDVRPVSFELGVEHRCDETCLEPEFTDALANV
jgi:hypothetical protein